MKGRLAVMTKFSADFHIREYTVPEVEPDAALVADHPRRDLRVRPPHLARRAPGPDRRPRPRPDLRPRDVRGDRAAREERQDGLDGRPLTGGRPGHLLLLLSVRPLPRAPRRPPGRVPEQAARDPVRGRPASLRRLVRRATSTCAPVTSSTRCPDSISDDVATPVNCALAQVLYGLDKVRVRVGDTVVLQGAGGLGLNAAAVAKEMGAAKIIVIDQIPERLELARRFGADHTLSLQELSAARGPRGRGEGAHPRAGAPTSSATSSGSRASSPKGCRC